MKRFKLPSFVLLILLTCCTLSACGNQPGATTEVTPEISEPATTPSPSEPTATPTPLALEVNGEGICVEDFESELKRCQDAAQESGQTLTDEEIKQLVIDNFIDQLLLAQAARNNGFTSDDANLQSHIDALIAQSGGQEAFNSWQNQFGYDEVAFKRFYQLSIEAAWQRDQIINSIPATADQVNARQILLEDEGAARSVHQQLASGSDFETLASQYDPITGGYLGWFPKGYLTQPELNNAVFALEPGTFTDVIATPLGYHIIQVIERDPEHAISPNILNFLQHQALDNWIQEQRTSAQIQILE